MRSSLIDVRTCRFGWYGFAGSGGIFGEGTIASRSNGLLVSSADAGGVGLGCRVGQRANVLRPEGFELGRAVANEVVVNIGVAHLLLGIVVCMKAGDQLLYGCGCEVRFLMVGAGSKSYSEWTMWWEMPVWLEAVKTS